MYTVGANPEPLKEDAYLCACSHENRTILIIYKSNPKTLLCKSCYENPYLVIKSDIDVTFDIQTGEKLS